MIRLPIVRPFETGSSRKEHLDHIPIRAVAGDKTLTSLRALQGHLAAPVPEPTALVILATLWAGFVASGSGGGPRPATREVGRARFNRHVWVVATACTVAAGLPIPRPRPAAADRCPGEPGAYDAFCDSLFRDSRWVGPRNRQNHRCDDSLRPPGEDDSHVAQTLNCQAVAAS
jgi:hypothetical protein